MVFFILVFVQIDFITNPDGNVFILYGWKT